MSSASSQASETPLVSIVLPVRNEADFLEQCLQSVLGNDYPADRMEVLVVDGMSDDGTREIVQSLAAEDNRVRLLDNPEGIVPYAMNKGIREASGDIIIRVDGHATISLDYVATAVATLQAHPEAWCVGGPTETISTTLVGQAIAGAMTSPVGAGDAAYRLSTTEEYVDTLLYGAYRRWVFDKIGLFDEELVRNQDDELNLRLHLAGGKILLTPKLSSRYYSRSSLRKLAKQYYQYGFWRIRTIQKHRRPAVLRQMAPLVFVLAWIILIAGSLLWHPLLWCLAAFAAFYLLGVLIGTLDVARRCGIAKAMLAPIIFPILHFAYGFGSLKGVIWFLLLRRGLSGRPEDHPLSR